jgi:hypothetical protein
LYDKCRNGYHYTRPVEQFPQLPISEAEVFALLVAPTAIARYHGATFERPLDMAFRKLTGTWPAWTTTGNCLVST